MTFFGKARKEDLILLASELGEDVTPDLKIIDLKKVITSSDNYEEEFVKEMLNTIISQRQDAAEEKKRAAGLEKASIESNERIKTEQMKLELEKIRLEIEARQCGPSTNTDGFRRKPVIDLLSLMPRFDPNNNDINLYLVLFERQAQLSEVPKEFWASNLIGLLPYDVAQLIARESDDVASDYDRVKLLLLKRFKLTAEKFRQLFVKHNRTNSSSWQDFAYELRNFFQGWVSGLEITTFKQLGELIISDQIKRKVPADVKDHFIDEWCQLNTVEGLVKRLDDYEAVRVKREPAASSSTARVENKRYSKQSRRGYPDTRPNFQERSRPENFELQPKLTCYGCGRQGYGKAKCPTFSPNVCASAINLHACHISSSPIALLDVEISDIKARVCADTGATCSIAGETLFKMLKEKGAQFQTKEVVMTLANGSQTAVEACATQVLVNIEGRKFNHELLALPEATGNRTLLGNDFLEKTGIVLDIQRKRWHFGDEPHHKIYFRKDIHKPSLSMSNIVANECRLRENEGEPLTPEQRQRISILLSEFEDTLKPGGDPTPLSSNTSI
nr:uncharacterized protein LOC122273114 [Parasteatoda tepidariorum]